MFEALPRKQGKTEKLAATALYLLLGQGKSNQRVYTASGDTEQAALIFGAAREMVEADPVLSDLCRIYHGNNKIIEYPKGRGFIKVLSATPKSKHGLGPTAVLIDEFHVVEEELVNVLTTGFGARKDPLTWMITTAGWDRHSLCFDEWQYAIKVRDGVIDDPTYYPIIYAADPEDDWEDEAVWYKAMPALGDFCSIEFIRDEYRKAKERPRFENTFRQLYLNQWTEQAERWLALDAWDACQAEIDPAELAGEECYAGLDLASIYDLAALSLWFPRKQTLLTYFWAPEESVLAREKRDRVPYSAWSRADAITLTPGETIDYDYIEQDIFKLHRQFRIIGFAADPWNFEAMGQRLIRAGVPNVVKFGQGFQKMNAPSKEFERLIVEGDLQHQGNPVMRWCVSNVAVETDSSENIRPSKKKSTERIDGVVASVVAIGMGMGQNTLGYIDYQGLTVL